jgi:hypothetical protein
VIDADEDAHGGAGVGVEKRDELVGAAIKGLSVNFECTKKSEFVGMGGTSGREGENAFGADGMLTEEVGG